MNFTTPRSLLDLRLLTAGAIAAAASLIGLAGFAPSAQASIYWLASGGAGSTNIGTAKTDGTDVNPSLVNFPGGMGAPSIPNFGLNDSNLYWVTSTFGMEAQSKMFRAELNGENPVEILTPPAGTTLGAIGFSSEKLFTLAAAFPGGVPTTSIARADLDGLNLELDFIDQATLGRPLQLQALATDSDHIYYSLAPTGPTAPRKIGKVGTNGTNPDSELITTPEDPGGLAVAGGKIFWTERFFVPDGPPPPSTKVLTANTDGSGITEIATGSTGVTAVAADETYVYWGTNQGKIGRARHNGSSIEPDFITGASMTGPAIRGLAVGGGSPGPGPDPDPVATLGKVTVSGPGKVKRGKTATWKVTIPNTGTAAATGVRVAVSGRGIKVNTPAAQIAPGKARVEVIKARLRKPGKFTATFRVNTANAGSKTVKRKITVRK